MVQHIDYTSIIFKSKIDKRLNIKWLGDKSDKLLGNKQAQRVTIEPFPQNKRGTRILPRQNRGSFIGHFKRYTSNAAPSLRLSHSTGKIKSRHLNDFTISRVGQ